MLKLNWLWSILVVLSVSIPSFVFANGINPPRPTGSTILEATCTHRTSKEQLVFRRVQLIPDEIQVRLPGAAVVGVKLSNIKKIELPGSGASADGFSNATIQLLNPEYQGKASIRLKDSTSPANLIQLEGFNANKTRARIALESCVMLDVRTSEATSSELKAKTKPKH